MRPFKAVLAGLVGAVVLSSVASADIDKPRQTELLNFLEQDCGSCHGLKRKGGLGTPLTPENIAHLDDEMVADIILNGVPNTAMPPWKALISEEEAHFLIKHLREGLN
ncbi:cytochrome c [Terasakiella sp. A23]|uniref:c-type cytochrome n=1 Tax=Terasakiella sp. FCG-A23 TaxID=3080561 RepID=UPI00295358A6|nr:cytochrome c [Terasakiella sp. A23]MDV7341281.1 cytochrome c [Terasakiella sp. A23]